MKRDKYAKTVVKIQVREIFHKRDIGRNVLPKFIETETLHPHGHQHDGNQQKHMLPSFATKA